LGAVFEVLPGFFTSGRMDGRNGSTLGFSPGSSICALRPAAAWLRS
jgi:hypothetical protein